MLAELFPRAHVRFASQPLLGPYLDGFVEWLYSRGYPDLPIRRRIRKTPHVDAALHQRGVRDLCTISREQLFELAPRDSQDDIDQAATVRSLADYLGERGLLARPMTTQREMLVAAYRDYLERVRGLAASTVAHHSSTASELLDFLGVDGDRTVLRQLGPAQIEAFQRTVGTRVSRETMQHIVAHLRSFLRFLASRNEVARGLDTSIDTPRVYRGERLPRALAWETALAFLTGIDRTTPMGQRDYAMFLLIATYGLRTCEVAALRLDDIEWRAGRLRVPRPKTRTPIALPLTKEVGAAVVDYVQHSRPELPYREVFLRTRPRRTTQAHCRHRGVPRLDTPQWASDLLPGAALLTALPRSPFAAPRHLAQSDRRPARPSKRREHLRLPAPARGGPS